MHKRHPVFIPQYCTYMCNIFAYNLHRQAIIVLKNKKAHGHPEWKCFFFIWSWGSSESFKRWHPRWSTVQKTAVSHLLLGTGKVGECPEYTWSSRCGKPRPSSWWRTTPSFPEAQRWGFRYECVLPVMTWVSPPCWNTFFPSCGVYTCKKI